MYLITRPATLKNASITPKALGWAKEIAGYVNKNYPGFDVQVGLEMFGHARVHWSYSAPTLEKLETANAKLIQDQKYWAMIETAKEFWVDGSLKDTIVMVVP